ncbi:MAG: hypothetical protein GY769_12000 [bacterium]|nr:hypothetical protein [bacterium]
MGSSRVGSAVLLATLSLSSAGSSFGQAPRLVKDLNTSGDGSGAFLRAEMGGHIYLVASEPDHGRELWKTDGTEEGTTLVKDVWPGPTPSETFYVANAGGTLFFSPDTEEFGKELWKSDGTEAGTVLVKDILPGPEPSFPEHFVAVNDTLFFLADDGIHGRELWKSDGTHAGTVLVKDIFSGDEFASGPFRLTASGERLFFGADDGVHGEELWVSDGTEAGTRLVKDIYPGERDSRLDDLYDWSGTLYFAAADDEHGQELWRSDGTGAGTVLVRDIYPGPRWSFPGGFSAVGDALFFAAEDPDTGAELHKTDGTEAGTVLVKDLRPGERSSFPSVILGVDGTAFFFARSEDFEDPELWTSDGTEAGTVLVSKMQPAEGYLPDPALAFAGRLVFAGEGDDRGVELWASDGTAAGTVRIKDISVGSESSEPLDLFRFGGRVLFSADDGRHGRELWATDGTEAGTALVRDINAKGTLDGGAAGLLELGGILYFASEDRGDGRELWRSDGTAAGTFMVRDINPAGDGFGFDIESAGGRLFFYANDGVHGEELWTSDGTTSGTRLVMDIVPGNEVHRGSSSRLSPLVGSESFVYFSHFSGEQCTLWRSDGSFEGTIAVFSSPSCPLPQASVGELVFFSNGLELWRSDGTPRGTFAIAEIDVLGSFKGFSGEFLPFGNLLLFVPGDSEPGRELWRTDGTRAGTFVVKDIAPGPGSSHPGHLVEHDGLVFFQADDGVHGAELWQTDGTAAGTSMVADLAPGPESSSPRPLDGVNGTMFFVVATTEPDGLVRSELWKTRGAGRETRFVSAAVQPFFAPAKAFGNHLYLASRDRATGNELWRSEGTRKGTVLVADIQAGDGDSSPSDFTAAGRNLFFNATSNRYGRELWVVGAGSTGGEAGKLTTVPDLDGLGSDEVAGLFSNVIVRDAASGAEILETLLGPRRGWSAVDFEPLSDVNGNGTAELAILARKRNRMRVFVRDALTGELLATLRQRRNHHPLDLEVIPGGGGGPPRLTVLSRRGLAQPSWLTVTSLAGARVLELPLGEDFEALDLEVAPALERNGRPMLVVLGQSGPGDRARLLAVDPETGSLEADWSLREGFIPVDLETVQQRPHAPGRAAVLVERETKGAVRVLTVDLQSGETLKTMRFGKKYRALDLEPAPGRKGSVGPAVSVLRVRNSDRQVRVSSRDAFSGRKLGAAVFGDVLLALDLATLGDLDGSGGFETVVLGEAGCAEGGKAILLRDSATGSRLGCHPLP